MLYKISTTTRICECRWNRLALKFLEKDEKNNQRLKTIVNSDRMQATYQINMHETPLLEVLWWSLIMYVTFLPVWSAEVK